MKTKRLRISGLSAASRYSITAPPDTRTTPNGVCGLSWGSAAGLWAIGVGQQLRIAVITGEAPVALGSGANQGEGMASGNVANTTGRWKTGAPVNGLLIGEATYRATAPVITYRDAEPMAARGKASAAGSARTTRLAHS